MDILFYMAMLIDQNNYQTFAVQCRPNSQAVVTCKSNAPKTRICLPAFPIDEVGSFHNPKVYCKRSNDGFYKYEVVLE